CEDVQRLVTGIRLLSTDQLLADGLLFDGGRDPDLAAPDNRRGMTVPRDRGFPRDVFRLVPGQRKILGAGMPLSIRSAPLRPGIHWLRSDRGPDDEARDK